MDPIDTRATRAPGLARVAGLAAALALATPAWAATKPSSRSAAPLATPDAESRQGAQDLPVDPTWRFGSALGLEAGLGSADFEGVALRLDTERDVNRLSPETTLAFVGSLSLTHVAGKKNLSVVVDPFSGRSVSGSVEWDANVFELVPTARVTYRATPAVSFVADGGLGLAYTASNARPSPAITSANPADPAGAGLGGVVRLAGGLVLMPSPGLRIALEAIGLRLRFGNGPGSGFDFALSISHRL